MPRAGLKALARGAEERPAATRETVTRLLGYMRPYSGRIAGGMAWLALGSAAGATAPYLTGRVVDTALIADSPAALTPPMLALIAMLAANWWATRMQIYILGSAGQYALVDVRRAVFDKVLDLSVAFFDRTESGDLMSRLVNDVETLNSFLSQGFRRLIGSALSLAATMVAMLLVDRRLALATLAVIPLMWVATRGFSAIAKRAFRRTREAIGGVSASLAEELAGVRVAQAFARTAANRDEFSSRNRANRDANIAASAVSSAFAPVLSVISAGSVAVVAAVGGWLATRDLVTVGVVVAFFQYARNFFNSVSQISALYADMQAALAGGERIFGVLDTPLEVREEPGAEKLSLIEGLVEFRDVSFAYSAGPEVLSGIRLRVEPGETLAIVGRTGAGKSTLASLLPRFYDPRSGAVLLDGHDIRGVDLASLRSRMGIVLQDPFLFSGTVAENVRYGRLDAGDDEILAAAGTARALPFIERLPMGFETVVGERGVQLSTGQRQLIAFARAILADPAVLILDEATSSVDTRTEALLQEAMRELLSGRTALVIAHRLSTVRGADRIVVLDAGRVVQEGSFDDLRRRGGEFSRLLRAQFGS